MVHLGSHRPWARRQWRALVVSILAAAFAAVLVAVPRAAAAATAPAAYVALGDSYTSVGTLLSPAPGSPWECGRDTDSYPYVAAKMLGLTIDDVSCGGATSADLGASQYPGVAAQFAALGTATRVVTVGIGGNDNPSRPSDRSADRGFIADAVIRCGGAGIAALWRGSPCKDRYAAQFSHEIAAEAPVIGEDLRTIHARAPNARVFVIGYADILPAQGTCWSSIPLASGDFPFLNGVERQLNQMLADQAAANDAVFVDAYAASVGHDACQPERTRWVEPLFPGTDAAPFHPNAAGQHAIGVLVARAISAAG
jgi:lysophospholipase L1-like esterase